MKELVYFWERGNDKTPLAGKGYKLSSRFNIEFEALDIDSFSKIIYGKITIEMNEKYIENFFGDNIVNLKVIVGMNGSGKTQLLKNIGRKSNESLYIYYDEGKFLKSGDFVVWGRNEKELLSFADNGYMFYYSPNYTGEEIKIPNRLVDISINSIAGHSYLSKESKEQFRFLFSRKGKEILSSIDINQSESIKISIQDYRNINISTILGTDKNAYLYSTLKKLLLFIKKKHKKLDMDNGNRNLLISVFVYIIYDIAGCIKNFSGDITNNTVTPWLVNFKNELEKEVTFFISLHNNKNNLYFNNLIDFLKESSLEKIHSGSIFERKLRNSLNMYINRFEDVKNLINEHYIEIIEYVNNKNTFLNFKLEISEDNYKNINRLIIEFEHLNDIDPKIASITWNQWSYGERAFVNLFSRIYRILGNRKKGTIQLMLDEGEVGFHPEWQRNYINYLLTFFNSFPDLHFELFISTHSPLVLTDIPKDNIIFLQNVKDIEKPREIEYQTFAQNIHTILYDSFFLEKGTIGAFAKKKIEELVDEINARNPTMNPHEIWKQIQVIGEPIIRKKLEELYNEKYSNSNERKKRILELERELEQLKKEEENDSN